MLRTGGVRVMDGAVGSMLLGGGGDGGCGSGGDDGCGSGCGGAVCVEELCLSDPERVAAVHRAYIDAGADIITTNSFCASRGLLARLAPGLRADEVNFAAARIARAVADGAGRHISVAGSMGPGDDEAAARERAAALLRGGVDLLLIETMTGADEAAASLRGAIAAMAAAGREVDVIVSATVDAAGRLPSGDTPAQFCDAVTFAHPYAIGLNCGPGPAELAAIAPQIAARGVRVSLCPSAGIPDEAGRYPVGPEEFGRIVGEAVKSGIVGIAGGCCGTTPAHIKMLRRQL